MYLFKRNKIFLFIIAFCLITLTIFCQETPDQTMAKLISLFKSYQKNDNGLTAKQKEENKIIGSQIEEIFHFDSLIQGALKDQWDNMSVSQRNEFYIKFKKLVELIAYPQGSYFYNNSKNIFKKAKFEGELAIIDSDNYNYDKDIDITITYIFKKIEGKWVMVDISMRGRSLVDEYKFRINRIVKKNGLNGLLETLSKKYDEILKRQEQK